MRAPSTVLRRVLAMIAVAFTASAALLIAEVLIARRTPRLPTFTREELDGRVGGGTGTPLRVAWIGDSTGTGVGASSPDRAFSRSVASKLGRPVDLTVVAQSGARVDDAIAQASELDTGAYDWIFVGIGSNDVTGLTRRSVFRERVDRLLSAVVALRPARVIVIGIGEFASTPLLAQPLRWLAGRRGVRLNADLRAAAERHGAEFVDIRARTGASFVDDPARYHARDRFHPSDAGYALWTEATLDALGIRS